MALKFVIDSLEEVDPVLRSHYAAENGKFSLATHGDHPKVAEFRDKNVELLKTVAKFEGVDPNAVKADREKITALETQLATETSARAAAQQKADRGVLRDALRGKALAAGVLPAAVDILLDKAEPMFEVKGDALQARPNTFSPSRPGESLTPDEWVATAVHDFPFLFAPSVGSGADPKRANGGTTDGKRVIRNPTARDLGENASAIAKGEVRIEYTT
jgi:hypothetical protein